MKAMMKQLIGGLAAATLMLSVLAPAAFAAVEGVAVFEGTAAVGDSFTPACTKGAGMATGKGLGLPTDPATAPDLTHKNNTWSLSTDFAFVGWSQDGKDVYLGTFQAWGYLGAPLNQQDVVGATCVSTKGQHGVGSADAVGTVDPDRELHIKLFNIGWKAALGGTLLITGNYQELGGEGGPKKDKMGTILAVVQAQPDDANPIGCVDNTQTAFDVEGAATLLNTETDAGKHDDDPVFGEKKCAGGPCPEPGPGK